jgi:hypothetical protein
VYRDTLHAMTEQSAEDPPTCDECGKPLISGFQNTIIVEVETQTPKGRVHRDCAEAFIAKHGGEPAEEA